MNGAPTPQSPRSKTQAGTAVLLLLGLLAFAAGLYHLFRLRFDTGDVYPPYSSLRADPLGTMALLESLQRMPGISVRRDYSASNKLPDGKNTTYLHLAADAQEWQEVPTDLAREIDGFVARGGRLAITFFPENRATPGTWPGPRTKGATNSTPAIKPATGPRARPLKRKRTLTSDEEEESLVSLQDKWGWDTDYVPLKPGIAGSYHPDQAINQTTLPLPDQVSWHSALIFTNLAPSWRVIYARGTNPVVVERRFGSGSVVLATDSYFLSNEALSKERHADLLAWLIGPNTRVFFDEAHLGVVENPGVASLMRRYRLYWLGAGLLLLAALFIWKNAAGFVPPYPEEERESYVAGKEAAAGFVNLLRRNVPAREVLNVCFAEWTKSLLHGNPHLIARVDQAQEVLEKENALPASIRKPAETYRKMCEILGPNYFS